MYYDYMVQIRKPINVIYQIIKLEKENQVIISDTEKSIWKYLTSIPDKKCSKNRNRMKFSESDKLHLPKKKEHHHHHQQPTTDNIILSRERLIYPKISHKLRVFTFTTLFKIGLFNFGLKKKI